MGCAAAPQPSFTGKCAPIGSGAVFFTEGESGLPAGLEALFDSCARLETQVVRRGVTVLRTHPLWKCSGFKGLPHPRL